MTTLTLLLAIFSAWVLLVGFGELWYWLICKYFPFGKIQNSTFSLGTKTFVHRNSQEFDLSVLYCLTRSISALPVILILWSFEYTYGLGRNLGWILVPLLLFSFLLIYKAWGSSSFISRKVRIVLEAAFLSGLILTGYYLYQNPDINASSERTADLCHTVAMSQGGTLPSDDPWLPPFKADSYYTGQYYAGGLVSRLCGLGPGQTYISSFILCAGWISTLVAALAWVLGGGRLLTVISTLMLVSIGGNFAPLLIHFTHKAYHLSDTMRYLGDGISVGLAHHTEFGRGLALLLSDMAVYGKPEAKPNCLPVEVVSYVFQLGDWHPQMGGFLILSLVILGVVCCAISRQPQLRVLGAGLAVGALPALALFNTWLAPVGALIVFVWFLPLWLLRGKAFNLELLTIVVVGLLFSVMLLNPLISLAEMMDRGFPSKMTLIASAKDATYTPWLGWFIIMGPSFLWVVLCLIGNRKGDNPKNDFFLLSRVSALTVVLLLVCCEVVFFDDVYKGHYERFNTALKWYPATLLTASLMCAPLALSSRLKYVARTSYILVLLLTVVNFYNILTKQVKAQVQSRGDFSGSAWITATPAKAIHDTLLQLPSGVVLEFEHQAHDGFTAKSFALFTGHKSFLGWAWHLTLWKGPDFKIIQQRREQAKDFYKGTLKNVGTWAVDNNIDYVIWSICLQDRYEPGKYVISDEDWERAWQINNDMLKPYYNWIETKSAPRREGLWVLKGYAHKVKNAKIP